MKAQQKLIIRRFHDEDAEAVSSIIRTTMLTSNATDYPISILQPLHDYFSPSKVKILANERYCLVAVLGMKIIGTGAYEAGELKTIFVLPNHQRKGVGNRLVLELEKQARSVGVTTMKVPASISGVSFYERLGYIKINTFLSKNAGKQTLMEKIL